MGFERRDRYGAAFEINVDKVWTCIIRRGGEERGVTEKILGGIFWGVVMVHRETERAVSRFRDKVRRGGEDTGY
jgi:hypothetical protein